MKVRSAKKKKPTEPGGDPHVKVVFVENTSSMVTLDDPTASVQEARGGFARIRPPETMTPEEVRAWADQARAIAKAVRVLPTRRSNTLGTPTRVGVTPSTSIREEVDRLLTEQGDADLRELCEGIMSEVDL